MNQDGAYDNPDERLADNVRPANWTNPRPSRPYHLVAIGAGPAGLIAAAGAAGLGARVALIERTALGGDCLNVGCVPSKALLRAARAMAECRHAREFGIELPGPPHVNFAAVMSRLRRIRAEISRDDSAYRYRNLGVDVFLGEASFAGPNRVRVGGDLLRFRRALIATGSRPRIPELPGLQEVGFLTNESIFDLAELPRRMLILGGGPIGCELGQAFARLGTDVQLVESGQRLLPRDDTEAAGCIAHQIQRDGVKIHFGAQLERVEAVAGEKIARLRRNSESFSLATDAILVAIGRAPNVERLNLEAALVDYDRFEGVKVDDHLRTTNRRVFAAGDVCSRYRFTHAADAMARLVIQNALFLGRKKSSSLIIPWCTYTEPELAQVGLTEQEASSRGIPITCHVQRLDEVNRAQIDCDEGFVKVLVRRGTDRIVGATIVSQHAGDLIAEVALAMAGGLGLSAIGRTIHPYPTRAEAIRKTADAYQRSRFTPRVASLLKKWFAIWR